MCIEDDLKKSIGALEDLGKMIEKRKMMDPEYPIITAYSLLTAYSAFEKASKDIITKYFSSHGDQRILNVVDHVLKIHNPSYEAILEALGKIDKDWKRMVKKHMEGKHETISAINSLVNNRNSLSHACNISCTYKEVIQYFSNAVEFLSILENVVLQTRHISAICATLCENMSSPD